jgi:hypothetical protein
MSRGTILPAPPPCFKMLRQPRGFSPAGFTETKRVLRARAPSAEIRVFMQQAEKDAVIFQ